MDHYIIQIDANTIPLLNTLLGRKVVDGIIDIITLRTEEELLIRLTYPSSLVSLKNVSKQTVKKTTDSLGL